MAPGPSLASGLHELFLAPLGAVTLQHELSLHFALLRVLVDDDPQRIRPVDAYRDDLSLADTELVDAEPLLADGLVRRMPVTAHFKDDGNEVVRTPGSGAAHEPHLQVDTVEHGRLGGLAVPQQLSLWTETPMLTNQL